MVKSVSFEDQGILSKIREFLTLKMVLIILGIIFVIGLLTMYLRSRKVAYEHFQDGSKANKTAEIMLFSVDWCPHCKTAKPVWDELKTEYQNKTINGYSILFTEINCTTETAEIEKLIAKYKIEGYPTIKLLKDGQIIEYDAKPTKDTLVQFLNTAL